MSALVRHWATPVWLLLSLATGVSLFLGHQSSDHRIGSVAVIVIAMVKIRFVMLWFMELRHVPLAWRLVFEGWMAVVCIAMIILYWTIRP